MIAWMDKWQAAFLVGTGFVSGIVFMWGGIAALAPLGVGLGIWVRYTELKMDKGE